jgi:hypothetical protein
MMVGITALWGALNGHRKRMMAIRTNLLQRNGISGVAASNRVRAGGRFLQAMMPSGGCPERVFVRVVS